MGIFGSLRPKMLRAQHMMAFPPILMGRCNEMTIFRVIWGPESKCLLFVGLNAKTCDNLES